MARNHPNSTPVVHLSPWHHTELKQHAEKLGLSMRFVVEKLIELAGSGKLTAYFAEPVGRKRAPVKLKPLAIIDGRTDEQKRADGDLPPWQQPPFWAGRDKQDERRG